MNSEVKNSLSSNNLLEKRTCPNRKPIYPPKLSIKSFEEQEKKLKGLFLDETSMKKLENEQEDPDEESFLDSPDCFLLNMEEEKVQKPSSLFFKRGKKKMSD